MPTEYVGRSIPCPRKICQSSASGWSRTSFGTRGSQPSETSIPTVSPTDVERPLIAPAASPRAARGYSRSQLLANAAIAASRVAPEIAASRVRWNLGAAASERQYLASLRNLLANDYAATYLDASFVAVIAARRWNVGWMRGISGSARWSRCHNRFESNGLDH